MALLLDDLMAYLATQSIGTAATDLFAGRRPESPDACVALFEYPGMSTEHVMEGVGLAYERPRLQVQCRGVSGDYQTPRQKAQDVMNALESVINETLGSAFYLRIMAQQTPFEMDRDANERVIIACNYQVWKRPSA